MGVRHRRRGPLIAAAALAGALASAVPATALDAPQLSATVPPLTAADAATFSWSEVTGRPGRFVGYQGGMGEELTGFAGERSATRELREGSQTFRIRAVELGRGEGGGPEVVASAWTYLTVVSDQTPPRIEATGRPAGWTAEPVTIRFTCTDTVSGVASCSAPVRVSGEGANQSVTGVATDRVGRRSTAMVDGIDIDRTPPAAPRLASVGRTSSARPTLSWSSADNLSGIETYRISLDGRQVAAVGGNVTSYTPSGDLPAGRHTWSVLATDRAGNAMRSDVAAFEIDVTVPETPSLQGPPGLIADREPVFRWSGLPDARFSWDLQGPQGTAGRARLTRATSFQARDLPDGAYTFQVAQTNAVGTTGGAATLGFTVDATPPRAPVVTLAPTSGVSPAARAVFRWRPAEPRGTFQWRITDRGGAPVQGPGRTDETEARPEPLSPGSYIFRVNQIDAAGNVGPMSDEVAFEVTSAMLPASGTADRPGAGEGGAGRAAPARPEAGDGGTGRAAAGRTAAVIRRPAATQFPVQNARLLRPRSGAVVTGLRPRLRWRGAPRAATLYNVQLFVMRGQILVKVHTAFPTQTAYRPPPGVLRRGQVYVWRVWPSLGRRGFAPRPLGVSWFRTRGSSG